MNRDNFYIFQNENGEIYAHTTDTNAAYAYIDQAIKAGFIYRTEKNGVATIVTVIEKESSIA